MLQLPVILESYRSLVDKSFKIVFATNELTPEQAGALNQSIQQFGYLAFKIDQFKKKEIEAMESLESDYEDTGKTPGQRLRGVLWHVWNLNNDGFDSFSKFYDHQMEVLISHFKKKLP